MSKKGVWAPPNLHHRSTPLEVGEIQRVEHSVPLDTFNSETICQPIITYLCHQSLLHSELTTHISPMQSNVMWTVSKTVGWSRWSQPWIEIITTLVCVTYSSNTVRTELYVTVYLKGYWLTMNAVKPQPSIHPSGCKQFSNNHFWSSKWLLTVSQEEGEVHRTKKHSE